MFEDMQSINTKIAREHDQALELLSSKVESELLSVVTSVTTVVASTASLQKQLVSRTSFSWSHSTADHAATGGVTSLRFGSPSRKPQSGKYIKHS